MAAIIASGDSERQKALAYGASQAGLADPISCATGREALARIAAQAFTVCYTDYNLPDMDGTEFLRQARQQRPDLQVLIGAPDCSPQHVIDAFQAGATDFIIDPLDRDLIRHAVEKAARCADQKMGKHSASSSSKGEFITRDPSVLGLLAIAKKVAPSSATILITGESGTGKEVLAAFIHAHSKRGDQPFLAVNCAALPDQLAESELFGHEKGAFTGAIGKKIGKFEGAGNGTLILDEVTEMALPLQAKFLRALQEKEVVRIGSNEPTPVNARVIAISNQHVRTAVASGTFREDLFFRLNVIPLTIPPLRERKNDIPLLADHFLGRFSDQNASTVRSISPAAMDLLQSHAWPGNVRELENAIERGVLIGAGDVLEPDDLLLDPTPDTPSDERSPSVGVTVREMEKDLIFKTLESVNDNRTHAAKMLGISIRTLRNKLNEYRQAAGPSSP